MSDVEEEDAPTTELKEDDAFSSESAYMIGTGTNAIDVR